MRTKRIYRSKASWATRFVAWIVRILHRKAIYVSGPMTGYTHWNRPAFTRVAHQLRERGYTVVSPADYPDGVWRLCLIRDLILMLLFCNKIALLPQWKHSRGATLEVYVAKALSYQVKPYRYWLIKRG